MFSLVQVGGPRAISQLAINICEQFLGYLPPLALSSPRLETYMTALY